MVEECGEHKGDPHTPRQLRRGKPVKHTCTATERTQILSAADEIRELGMKASPSKVKVRLGVSAPGLDAIKEVLRNLNKDAFFFESAYGLSKGLEFLGRSIQIFVRFDNIFQDVSMKTVRDCTY